MPFIYHFLANEKFGYSYSGIKRITALDKDTTFVQAKENLQKTVVRCEEALNTLLVELF